MKNSDQALTLPDLWAKYVNTNAVVELLALYHENATLLPTFSKTVARGQDMLNEYFKSLAAKEDLQVFLHNQTISCQAIAESSYAVSGFYDFQFKNNGELKTFPSRFTFIIDLTSEKPILHHHSSEVPINVANGE